MRLDCEFVRISGITKDFIPQREIGEYYSVPNFPRILISKEGNLIHGRDTYFPCISRDWKIANNRIVSISYDYLHENGETQIIIITKLALMAAMFLPKPDCFPDCFVEFINHNRSDFRLENLKIVPLHSKIQDQRTSILATRQLLKTGPVIPSDENPGYFKIPGFSYYEINPKTQTVISRRKTLEFSKLHPSTTPKGYRGYTLWSDDGLIFRMSRHRLLALLFLRDDENYGKLVNHLNTTPGDDWLNNLEWATPSGNVQHAWDNDHTPTLRPVQERNVDTGEVINHRRVIDCARHNGLSRDQILFRLSKQEQLFPERKQYRDWSSITENNPWLHIENPDQEIDKNVRSNKTLVKNCITGEITEYDTQREVAKFLGVKEPAINGRLNNPQHVYRIGPNQYYQMKSKYSTEEWLPIENLQAAYFSSNRVLAGVIAHRVSDGKDFLYPSAKTCADHHALKNTTLNFRLKRGSHITYRDGFNYRYFDPEKDHNLVFFDE